MSFYHYLFIILGVLGLFASLIFVPLAIADKGRKLVLIAVICVKNVIIIINPHNMLRIILINTKSISFKTYTTQRISLLCAQKPFV